jgi:hypothetical protein
MIISDLATSSFDQGTQGAFPMGWRFDRAVAVCTKPDSVKP